MSYTLVSLGLQAYVVNRRFQATAAGSAGRLSALRKTEARPGANESEQLREAETGA